MLAEDMIATNARLRTCVDPDALLATATREALLMCPFDRAVVATVDDGRIGAPSGRPLPDDASERLRRRLCEHPVTLRPGTEEEFLLAGGTRADAAGRPSQLAERLGLRDHLYAPAVLDGHALALLILDRDGPAVAPTDVARAGAVAFVLALAIDRLALRRRAHDLADELARFADVARSLSRDLIDAPVALPADRGLGPALPRVSRLVTDDPLFARLSARERRVVQLLAEGRSNREIGEALLLSPETVKTHVGRILRKIGAGNRVEAVAMLVRGSG